MNKAFAGWKYALIIAITLLGALLALPNWFGKSPTVQMQFASPEAATAAAQEVTTQLHAANIEPSRWKVDGQNLNLFFPQTDRQIPGQRHLGKPPAEHAAMAAIHGPLADEPRP